MKGLNICLFVHDVNDAAVHRRVAMLAASGANVTTLGFVRDDVHRMPEGSDAVVLGRTHNARFLHRIGAVLRQVLTIGRREASAANADLFIARNLEMLLLAVIAARRTGKRTPVVYECLDIHRLMLGGGLVARLLRVLERHLAASCAGLITSSPAYVEHYFHDIARINLPVVLVENRVFGLAPLSASRPPADAPPWVIAWNGAIRCAKSLAILNEVTMRGEGSIRVVIRGRVSYDQIPDFDLVVAANPWIDFRGPYTYPDDLDAIYDHVHFNWTIDMFWEGQNSTWALANRIYEGGRAGVVPIAQRSVETGQFFERLGIGVLLDDLTPTNVVRTIMSMRTEDYAALSGDAAAVPLGVWTMGAAECEQLSSELHALIAKKLAQD
jgi:succinoglycan biosynthesis protein ExoL